MKLDYHHTNFCQITNEIHNCILPTKLNRAKKNNIALLVLDFATCKMIMQRSYLAGNTGILLEDIIKFFESYNYDVMVTTAIKCHKKNDYTKVSIKEVKEHHKNLIKEIYDIKPDFVITFGEKALSSFFGKSTRLKDFRNIILEGSEFKLKFTATYSLLSVIMNPSNAKEILRDCQLIMNKKNSTKVNYLVNSYYDLGNIFALDVETNGLQPKASTAKLITLAVTDKPEFSVCYNLNHPFGYRVQKEDLTNLFKRLDDENSMMIGHNVGFDYRWVKTHLTNNIKCALFDTRVAYVLIDENSPVNTLKFLSANLTDIPSDYHQDINTSDLENEPFDKVAKYNNTDADATYRVYLELIKQLEKEKKLELMDFMMSVLKAISDIELTGVDVDLDLFNSQKIDLEKKLATLDKFFINSINPASPKQLSDFLFVKNKLPVMAYTAKNSPATDTFNLKKLSVYCKKQKLNNLSIFIDKVIDHRDISKKLKTFYYGMEEYIINGKIYPNYNIGKSSSFTRDEGTVTGRLSSTKPNLQNIPRKGAIKNIFVPPNGYKWLDADYSQLEMRVAAWFSKESKLIDYFNNNKDFHTAVFSELIKRDYTELKKILDDDNHPECNKLSEDRVTIKSINFGILYGAGASMVQQLSEKAGVIVTKEYCQEMINKWFRTYPNLAKWLKNTKEYAIENGCVASPTGRERHLLGIENVNDPKSWALQRQAINFPIQTLASEICLAGILLLSDLIHENRIDAKIVLTVHDSICVVFSNSINEDYFKALINQVLTKKVPEYFNSFFGFNFNVPLDVKIKISDRLK